MSFSVSTHLKNSQSKPKFSRKVRLGFGIHCEGFLEDDKDDKPDSVGLYYAR